LVAVFPLPVVTVWPLFDVVAVWTPFGPATTAPLGPAQPA
jgi:hypothetical protein